MNEAVKNLSALVPLALVAMLGIAMPAAAEPEVCGLLQDAAGRFGDAEDVAGLVSRMPPAAGLAAASPEPADRQELERDGVPLPKAAAIRAYRLPLTDVGHRPDLVLETEAGPLQCRRYHWYRHGADGRLQPVTGPSLGDFESQDGLCRTGGQSLAFVRRTGEPVAIIAAMDRRPLDAALDDPPYSGSIALFRLKPEGGADQLCRIKLPPR